MVFYILQSTRLAYIFVDKRKTHNKKLLNIVIIDVLK